MACYIEQDAKINAVTVSPVYNLQWFSDIICVIVYKQFLHIIADMSQFIVSY